MQLKSYADDGMGTAGYRDKHDYNGSRMDGFTIYTSWSNLSIEAVKNTSNPHTNT